MADASSVLGAPQVAGAWVNRRGKAKRGMGTVAGAQIGGAAGAAVAAGMSGKGSPQPTPESWVADGRKLTIARQELAGWSVGSGRGTGGPRGRRRRWRGRSPGALDPPGAVIRDAEERDLARRDGCAEGGEVDARAGWACPDLGGDDDLIGHPAAGPPAAG